MVSSSILHNKACRRGTASTPKKRRPYTPASDSSSPRRIFLTAFFRVRLCAPLYAISA